MTRSATIADAHALVPLFAQLGYPTDVSAIQERIASLNPASQVFVAEEDGRIAGFVVVALCDYFVVAARAEIQGIVVADDWRNKGIGSALLDVAEKWASQRGASLMHLTSNAVREAAHAFYERRGYSIIKSERVFEKAL